MCPWYVGWWIGVGVGFVGFGWFGWCGSWLLVTVFGCVGMWECVFCNCRFMVLDCCFACEGVSGLGCMRCLKGVFCWVSSFGCFEVLFSGFGISCAVCLFGCYKP